MAESENTPAVPEPVCSIWNGPHRWVYQSHGARGVLEDVYECACGRKALDVQHWADAPQVLEPDEEAELLELMSSPPDPRSAEGVLA